MKKKKDPNFQAVLEWVATNAEFMTDLTKVLKQDYETMVDMVPVELHADLREQVQAAGRRILAEEISHSLGASMLDIAEVLEEISPVLLG